MRRIFAHIIDGDAPAMLAALDRQHELGVDPLAIVRGLLGIVHAVTLHKTANVDRALQGDEDIAAIAQWAEQLGHAPLHRLWQLLLKGHDEVDNAPIPREACEMGLLRVLHAASMPDPGSLAKLLEQGHVAQAPAESSGEKAGASEPAPPASIAPDESPPWAVDAPATDAERTPPKSLDTLEDIVALLEATGKLIVASQVEREVRLVELGEDRLVIQTASGRDDVVGPLREALAEVTGRRWQIEPGNGEAAPTLFEQRTAREQAERDAIFEHPLVRAAKAAFPDAQVLEAKDDPAFDHDNSAHRSAQA